MSRIRIKMKQPYNGFARSVLVEDLLVDEEGPFNYEVLEDTAVAYVLSMGNSEVKVSLFEGLYCPASFFRIASFPAINTEDKVFVTDLDKYAKSEARQAIRKQEDARLVALLLAAAEDFDQQRGDRPSQIVKIGKCNRFDSYDFDWLIGRIKQHEIQPELILANPVDACDFYRFDRAGVRVCESVVVPEGTSFVVPNPGYLGVMPNLYGRREEPNPNAEQFKEGWVFDEVIGMLILNPRGIGVWKKES